MANGAKDIEDDNLKTEAFVLKAVDADLTILTLLQEACTCSNYKRQLDLLEKCASHTLSCERSNVEYLLSLEQFQKELMYVIDLAIIPPFETREYFSYEKDDFQKYPEITYYVLLICNHILDALPNINRSENASSLAQKQIYVECEKEQTRPIQDTTFFLAKLLLLIGAHRNSPMWSSIKLEDLSLQVLNKLLLCFSCESTNELFSSAVYSDYASGVKVKRNQVMLLKAILSHCWKPLSRETWHQNPFLCHSFHWLISQMKLPHLSDYIEQIMSVAINFMDDHQPIIKIRGIICLHHLIKNTSAEELRWLNRAEVVYEKLKNQMYSKEPSVLECLFPCLFDILRILESPPDLDRHHYVLDALLRDTEGENLLALRKIYVSSLTILLEQVGIHGVCYLKTLIKIAGNYLEVDDGFGEASARPDTLKFLEVVIKVAWPRIQPHVDAILKMTLNFIADVNCVMHQDDNISEMQSDLTAETIRCLILLSEVYSDVIPCVKAAITAGMDCVENNSFLFNVLQKQLAKMST